MGKYFTMTFWLGFYGAHNALTFPVLSSLFIISFTESCCFIIPPDTLLPFIAIGKTMPHMVFLVSFITFASVVGAAFGYLIGQKGGRPILMKFAKNPEKIEKVENYFNKYDAWAIGIAAFTPIPYKVFTIAAGVFNLNFVRFMLVSILARGTRYALIGGISFMLLKDKTPAQVEAFLHSTEFKLITLGIAAVVIIGYLAYRMIAGKKDSPQTA